jgi:hypothetical protein
MRLSSAVVAITAMAACLVVELRARAQTPSSAPPQASPTGGIVAGGLAPPAPMTNNPNAQTVTSSPTERALQKSQVQDSGRGLEWFYFNAEAGYEFVGLQTLKSSGLAYTNAIKTSDNGLMIGAGIGGRLMFWTLGARARLGMLSQSKVGTLNGEVGWHYPLGSLEPYFSISGGYAFLSSLDASSWGTSDVSIHGYNVRVGGGLDYYVTPVFSVGGNLTGEILGLSRGAISNASLGQATALTSDEKKAATASGSSVGGALTISAVLGLHF